MQELFTWAEAAASSRSSYLDRLKECLEAGQLSFAQCVSKVKLAVQQAQVDNVVVPLPKDKAIAKSANRTRKMHTRRMHMLGRNRSVGKTDVDGFDSAESSFSDRLGPLSPGLRGWRKLALREAAAKEKAVFEAPRKEMKKVEDIYYDEKAAAEAMAKAAALRLLASALLVKAYRRLSVTHHPDKGFSSSPLCPAS